MLTNLRLHFLAVALVAASFSVAAAPTQTLTRTAGVDVETRSALQAVVPADWTVQISPEANLPETLSWAAGVPWQRVLDDLSERNGVPVTLDTAGKVARVGVAPEPAPVTVTAAAPAVLAAPTIADEARIAPVSPPAPSSAPDRVAAPVAKATAAPADAFRYTAATALNRPSARSVAQGIANRYGMRMVWAAPELRLQGPVTLLSRGVDEDVQLLQKSMGVFSPVTLEVSKAEKVIRAVPASSAGQAYFDVAELAPAVEPAGLSGSADAASPKPKITLNIAANEPLEDALTRFTRAFGYTLEWKVQGGFEANRAMRFEGGSMAEVLSFLPGMNLSADIFNREKHVVVRPGDPARDH